MAHSCVPCWPSLGADVACQPPGTRLTGEVSRYHLQVTGTAKKHKKEQYSMLSIHLVWFGNWFHVYMFIYVYIRILKLYSAKYINNR